MAPRARLAIYKTCWEKGCSVADTVAAIDDAISDGVDLIQISISSSDVPFHQSVRALSVSSYPYQFSLSYPLSRHSLPISLYISPYIFLSLCKAENRDRTLVALPSSNSKEREGRFTRVDGFHLGERLYIQKRG
ncbi:hypothetical protein SUGI_0574840 [Cryptomeria japonica]|nr:hypothetical protein SUGI_0574840 [Cryptomeria japonica]